MDGLWLPSMREAVVQARAVPLSSTSLQFQTTKIYGADSSCYLDRGVIEAEDYSRVLLQVLVPLVRPPSQLDSGVLSPIQLILAGYSFGALQAIATSPPFITGLQFFTRYLLVSYPLSVVWALTLGNYARCLQDLKRVIANNHPILATYGDSDQFTSLSKYSVWADELAGHGGAFRGLKVDGADHFWGTQMGELLVSVQAWLDDTRQSTEVTVQ